MKTLNRKINNHGNIKTKMQARMIIDELYLIAPKIDR